MTFEYTYKIDYETGVVSLDENSSFPEGYWTLEATQLVEDGVYKV